MKTLLILLWLCLSLSLQASKHVFIYVQDYRIEPTYSLYWNMKHGITTYLNNDTTWITIEQNEGGQYVKYYNDSLDTYIEAFLSCNWTKTTMEFQSDVSSLYDINDNDLLFVLVGHNVMLDTTVSYSYESCYDNMLFGCYTENWDSIIDHSVITTSRMIAPEAYTVLPAIYTWINENTETEIRTAAALGYYSKQLNISLEEVKEMFLIKRKEK